MPEATYVGDELTLFSEARNWKAYFARHLAPFLHGDVLEVGAGMGGTTRALFDGKQSSWLCLEPDPALAAKLRENLRTNPRSPQPEVAVGTLDDLDPARTFDAILYIDVLEHIEDDRAELARAARRLNPGGTLIVLAPAYSFLFSEFDRAVGHFRRYTSSSLSAVFPSDLHFEYGIYLDSVGMLTSLVNRFVLKQGTPKPSQIKMWDRVLVPISRIVDPLVLLSFGRSVVVIHRRE